MPRYKLADNGLDPSEWTLEAANPLAAYEAFKAQWERWKQEGLDEYVDDPFQELELTIKDVVLAGDKSLKGPVPLCCLEIQKPKPYSDKLLVHLFIDFCPEFGDKVQPPCWKIENVQVKYCPYCGEQLPAIIELESPPEPLCRSNDGNYCYTCDQRLMCCDCNIPQSAYQLRSKMSYEIDTIRVLNGELSISKNQFLQLFEENVYSMPEISLFHRDDAEIIFYKTARPNGKKHEAVAGIHCPDPIVWNSDNNSREKLTWCYAGSGSTYSTFLKILSKTKGNADILVIWEGGDSVGGIRVSDGKVTEHTVDYVLKD